MQLPLAAARAGRPGDRLGRGKAGANSAFYRQH